MSAFLTSTNVPALAPSRRRAPGRRYANGPTVAPSWRSHESSHDWRTTTPSPTSASTSVLLAPMRQCAPTSVAPISVLNGSITVSRPTATSASIVVGAVVDAERQVRVVDDVPADRVAGGAQERQHVGEVALALGVVGADERQRG